MAGRSRKSKPITDLTRLITNHIEERNYLLFTLSERDPLRLKELGNWSLEGLYQFLYANNIHARRMEDARKNAAAASKTKGRP